MIEVEAAILLQSVALLQNDDAYHEMPSEAMKEVKALIIDRPQSLRNSERTLSTRSIPREMSSLEIVYANLSWPSPAEPNAVPGEHSTPLSNKAIAISSLVIPGTSTLGKT